MFLINYRKYGQFAAQGVLEEVQPHLDASEVIAESLLMAGVDAGSISDTTR